MNERLDLCRYQQAGRDVDHIKVFANVDAAEKWFAEIDPEGIAFEYEFLESKRPPGLCKHPEAGPGGVLGIETGTPI